MRYCIVFFILIYFVLFCLKTVELIVHLLICILLQEYDVEDAVLPLQPSLNYTAPELVRSKELSVGASSDMFSLGCLAYHLITHKPLLDCHNNVKMVRFIFEIFWKNAPSITVFYHIGIVSSVVVSEISLIEGLCSTLQSVLK